MPEAVRLARIAEDCLRGLGSGKGSRLVLSLFFKAILGIPRIFHFETLDDLGFAILTGGRKVLSRNTLGGLVRAAAVRGVLRFVHRTEPKISAAAAHTVSIDEQARDRPLHAQVRHQERLPHDPQQAHEDREALL